jgi:taurine dioxygenase
VLVFRDQELTPEALIDLGRRLGPLHLHPAAPSLDGHPEVMVIHADERSTTVNANTWHTDVSCDERPPSTTILYMRTVPPCGGDTLYASMCAAYDALDDAMQERLAGLSAQRSSAHVYRGRYGVAEADSQDGVYPEAVHPSCGLIR